MAGRRSHPRFAVASQWNGEMRVLRDVAIHRTDEGGFVALSQAPAIAGERMTLHVMGGGESMGMRVRVLDSRPVVIDGAVRHRIRLALDGAAVSAADAEGASEPLSLVEAPSR